MLIIIIIIINDYYYYYDYDYYCTMRCVIAFSYFLCVPENTWHGTHNGLLECKQKYSLNIVISIHKLKLSQPTSKHV